MPSSESSALSMNLGFTTNFCSATDPPIVILSSLLRGPRKLPLFFSSHSQLRRSSCRKAEMKVEIISKECIKPSSPTPRDLKIYKFCLLDQSAPSIYFPVILFYPMNQSTGLTAADLISERLQALKRSLSETLTRFYPFAGEIKDNLSVDCNDERVHYVEARVHSCLVDCLSQPNLALFHQLIPRKAIGKEVGAGDHVLMIQVTSFACGGTAIGLVVSHMFADGISVSVFLKGWAATAGKADESVRPNFDAPSIFIQKNAYPIEATNAALFKPLSKSGWCTTRRVLFDASAIAALKAKATSSGVQNPTRVEVVSALLWKCIMAAFGTTSGIQRPTFITHEVNLRRRAVPPIVESSIGNLLRSAFASCSAEEMDFVSMLRKLREAISKINSDFVKSLQGNGGFAKLYEQMKSTVGACSREASSGAIDYIAFSSWCNFGLYDIDFGWGKPAWVSSLGGSGNVECVFPNVVMLMDTRSGDGVEAWIWLDKEDMDVLGQNKELLALASLDPSPIN